ncbi:hypothetical protein JOB18_018877 [Solea senegalensis]|uniref:Uncharacterized protein n=1 Tax=Solea senegalensis TaxID=28829 RepID=A0AAV6R542_SOLSE|nr:hypothetical protein JOB18_018877 [Solea senegalensis]
MEVVLTRLRDFSCRTSTFHDRKRAGQSAWKEALTTRTDQRSGGGTAVAAGHKLDIESSLAWLRRELMEMRSQDQVLIRQLMELHSGIQELKQELSVEEEEEEGDTDEEEDEEEEEEEEGSYWDSESERGSSSVFSSAGEVSLSSSLVKTPPSRHTRLLSKQVFSRRSSVP